MATTETPLAGQVETAEVVTPSKPAQVAAALARVEAAPVAVQHGAAVPTNLDEQLKMAKWAVESGLLPEAISTAAKAWVIMQRGGELGFPGLTAFEFLYVVNGQVRLKPAGAKAKALSSGLLADVREEIVGEGDQRRAVVTIKRKGIPTPIVGTFSVEDAQTAKLWGKVGASGKPSAWVTYPLRMLLARARGFAYSDAFADIIGGLPVREVVDLDPGEALGDAPAAEPVGPRKPPAGGFALLKKAMAPKGPDASSQPQGETAAAGDGPIVAPASGGVAAAGRPAEEEASPAAPSAVVCPASAGFTGVVPSRGDSGQQKDQAEAGPSEPAAAPGVTGAGVAPSPISGSQDQAPTGQAASSTPAPSHAGVAPSRGDSAREDAAQATPPEAPLSSRGCDHAPAVAYRKKWPGTKPVVCETCAMSIIVTAKGPIVVEEPPLSRGKDLFGK